MRTQSVEVSHAGTAAETRPKETASDRARQPDSGVVPEQHAEAAKGSDRAHLSACSGHQPGDVSQADRECFEALLPKAEQSARFAFRYRSPETQDEIVAETLALCWRDYESCLRRGKHIWPSKIIEYAIGRVRNLDFIMGPSSVDVLGERTLAWGRAHVVSMHHISRSRDSDKEEPVSEPSGALIDRRTWEDPAEATRIKLDYAAFLDSGKLTERQRLVFQMLTQGYRTTEIAEALGVHLVTASGHKRRIREKLITFFGPDIDPHYRAAEAVA